MVHPDIVDEKELLRREALYSVFFKRLDYLLGLTDEWFDCKRVKKYVEDNNLKGWVDPFCFLANDGKPAKLRKE